MAVNFSIIGGGSIFSPEIADLIAQNIDIFGRVNIKFMDIDEERQKIVGGLCERIVKKSKADIHIQYVPTYEEAIDGCDYLLLQFRIGGEDQRIQDELLGRKYRIPFVETVSVCGVSTFLRSYYEIEKIAEIVKAKAPSAWVLNFANPAELIAEALYRCGVKNVIGVCNASTRLLQFLRVKMQFEETDNFYMNWRGLNHLAVVDSFLLNGEEILPQILDRLEDYESDRTPFPSRLCRQLGYLPNQYFQYYYLERDIIEKEQKELKVRSQIVKDINAQLLVEYEGIDYVPEGLTKRGGSGYSKTVIDTIISLHKGDNRIHYLVTQNKGAVTELPYDGFVEVPCVVNKNRVLPVAVEKLPEAAAPLIFTMKAFEKMLLSAVSERNKLKLYQSLMIHPLINCDSIAGPLLEDILEENKEYIPESFYKSELKK